jgi:sporulation protein YlmC with PRC-barrel domain
LARPGLNSRDDHFSDETIPWHSLLSSVDKRGMLHIEQRHRIYRLWLHVKLTIMESKRKPDNADTRRTKGRLPDATNPSSGLTASSIIGDRVQNSRGENLGIISDITINAERGSIDCAIIESGSFLGMGGRTVAVPFGELRRDRERKIFILDRDKESMKRTPVFEKPNLPEKRVHDYFKKVISKM